MASGFQNLRLGKNNGQKNTENSSTSLNATASRVGRSLRAEYHRISESPCIYAREVVNKT